MNSNRFLRESHRFEWTATPFRGVSHKVLRIQDDASGVIELTRIETGFALPPHRHTVTQAAYFLSGVAQALDGSIIKAGTYAEVPPGERHGTKAIEEVVLLNMFNGLVTWMLDDGDIFLLRANGEFAHLGRVKEFGTEPLPYL